MPETVRVARVLRPHGVRGETRIEIDSDVPGRFAPGCELLLTSPGRPADTVRVASFRRCSDGALIRFEGYDDRERAATLRGACLEVRREAVPEAPDGAYYHFELLGCRCVDAQLGELGRVVEVIEDGGGLLLRIDGGGRSLLVPFVEPFLQGVDVGRGRIDLRLPPGLVEACASGS